MLIEFGPFAFDRDAGTLSKGGTILRLGGMPLKILRSLLEEPGTIVSRKELQHILWSGTAFGDFEQGLNTAMNVVRKTLNDSAGQPRYIETVPGEGYRFIAPVRFVSSREGAISSAPTAHLSGNGKTVKITQSVEPSFEIAFAQRRNRFRPGWLMLSLVAAFGLAVLGTIFWSTRPVKPQLGYGVEPSRNRLANDQYAVAMNFLGVQNKIPEARKAFKRALDLDPSFSGARLQYVLAIVIEILNGYANDESRLYEAEEELHKAERATPKQNGLLVVAQTGVYLAEGRLDLVPVAQTIEHWRQSKYRGNPVWPVILLMLKDQTGEPVTALRSWLSDKPLENPPRMLLGELLRIRGSTAEAIGTLERALEQAPSNITAAWFLSMAYLDAGRNEKALSLLERMRPEFENNYMWRHALGIVLAAEKRGGEARNVMNDETLKFARLTWSVASSTADYYALLGDRARAIEWLQLAISRGDERISYFRRNQRLANLRQDPRFESLLRSVEARRR